jgi:hypothetical protein
LTAEVEIEVGTGGRELLVLELELLLDELELLELDVGDGGTELLELDEDIIELLLDELELDVIGGGTELLELLLLLLDKLELLESKDVTLLASITVDVEVEFSTENEDVTLLVELLKLLELKLLLEELDGGT